MSKHQYNPTSETESEASGNYHIKTYGNMHITMNGLFVNKIMTFSLLAKVLGMGSRTEQIHVFTVKGCVTNLLFYLCYKLHA